MAYDSKPLFVFKLLTNSNCPKLHVDRESDKTLRVIEVVKNCFSRHKVNVLMFAQLIAVVVEDLGCILVREIATFANNTP